MKPFYIYIFIIFFGLLMSACNNKKPSHEEQENEQFEEAINKVEELQEKAAQDSNFIKSKEYSSQMEKAAIEMSKKTSNMPVNERMLFEYEVALRNLKQYTNKLKQKPDLSRDISFMKETQTKADKVREYYKSLQKANLNPQEEEKFYKLNHQ